MQDVPSTVSDRRAGGTGDGDRAAAGLPFLEAGPEEGPRSALIVVLGGDPGGGPGDIGYPGLVELSVEIAVGAGVASPASDGEGGSGAGIGEGIGVLSDN